MTAYLSFLHMSVDFICILTLFHYVSGNATAFILYNFLAFALQLPFGMILDERMSKSNNETRLPLYYVLCGLGLCVIGSLGIYALCGLGNALFHSGGGVLAIREDRVCESKGRRLGVFVAPGAFGVTGGILLGASNKFIIFVVCTVIYMLLFSYLLYKEEKSTNDKQVFIKTGHISKVLVSVFCLLAVILRSIGGITLVYSWEKTTMLVILLTVATAFGKAGGGLLAARIGRKKTEIISLCLAAIFYFFSNEWICALLAVFFFNMTMPLTLQMESDNHFDMPGFAFGLLTFGLFLGYMFQYYDLVTQVPASLWGIIFSLATLILLLLAERVNEE